MGINRFIYAPKLKEKKKIEVIYALLYFIKVIKYIIKKVNESYFIRQELHTKSIIHLNSK